MSDGRPPPTPPGDVRALVDAQAVELARLEGRFVVTEAQLKHLSGDFAALRADLFAALSSLRTHVDARFDEVVRLLKEAA